MNKEERSALLRSTEEIRKAIEYIRNAHIYHCNKCGVNILRLKKVECPFCGGEMYMDD